MSDLDRVHALWADDPAAQAAGVVIDAVGDGSARISMPARVDMGNGHGIVHGGWIFLLADTALAYALATRVDGGVTTNADIAYHKPGRVGGILTAIATEAWFEGRAGVFDIVVESADGERLASMRGHGRAARNV